MTAPNLGSTRFGKVVYRVVAGLSDGPDANTSPDALPVTGFGTLTPRVERIIDQGDGTRPTQTVLPRPVTVSMVDGNLTYRGDPWVWLIASEAGVWRWHAAFTYKIGNEAITDEFLFDLTPGDPSDPSYIPTDLSTARVIVAPDTGLPTVIGPAGRNVQDVVLQPDGLLFVMSSGADIDVTIPYLGDLSNAATQAVASASAAATSETNAAASAQSAQTASTSAQASASAAGTHAGNAEASATTAAGASTNATTKAGEASASAVTAANNAVTSTTKASEAAASATAAGTSETNAAASAATATTKASEASASASAAATSATNAAASATTAEQAAEQAVNTVNSGVPDATATVKGGIMLAGDLGGTYTAPTVPGLAGKANASHTHATSDVTGLDTALGARELTANKGVADGYAPLDSNAKVPAANLPSYVDDVLEYANVAGFPATGAAGIIYIALDTNLAYRWSGSAFVEISPSLAIGTTGSTACAGNDARLSDARTPTDSSVTNAKVAANAAIALSKLAAGYMQGQRNGVATTTKVDVLTEAQYQTLVSGGTVDANTIYFRSA